MLDIYSFHPTRGLTHHESLDEIDSVDEESIIWIDLESSEAIPLHQVATKLGLHELTIEDCLTPGHFPKLEDFGNHYFILLRGLKPNSLLDEVTESEEDPEGDIFTEKVAIYMSERFVFTYRRNEVPWLDAILRQVTADPEKLLAFGTTALTHRVIDVLIDRFMRGMNFFENVIDRLEEIAIESPEDFDIVDLLELKRELTALRQMAREQRAVTSRLANDPILVSERSQRRYFKDVDDHAVWIIKALDKQIDTLLSLRDTHIAFANVRLGDTMRILAVITTIAAPLNLLVGLYGMNFEAMPLLHSPFGFWAMISVMISVSFLMLLYFRKKRWL